MKTTDASPYLTAFAVAYYALHDQLVEAGALPEGAASDALRRFKPGPDENSKMIAAILQNMASELDQRSFGNSGARRRLDVIDGGREE